MLGIGPNLAFILLIAGVLGIYAEFCLPGLVLPAVLGGILAALGVASLLALPIQWTGAALLVLGLSMVLLEAKFDTRGVLGLAGTAAMVLGATDIRVHPLTALATCIPFALITIFLASVALRARANKVEAK